MLPCGCNAPSQLLVKTLAVAERNETGARPCQTLCFRFLKAPALSHPVRVRLASLAICFS